MGCIYVIENTVNGKCYFGQTKGKAERRKNGHFNSLKKSKHVNRHLQSSWNKYGSDSFTFTVISNSEAESQLDGLERQLIEIFQTTNPEHGYNKLSGGQSNKKYSDETKKKMSEARKGKTSPNKGKKASEETIKKQCQAQLYLYANGYSHPMKGKKQSTESIEKRRQSLKKHYADGNAHPMQGKKHSPEAIEANRQARLKWYADGNTHPMQGRKQSPESIEKSRQANLGKRYSPTTEFKTGEHRSTTTEFKKGTTPLNKCPLLDSNGATWPSLSSVILGLGGSLSCLSTAIKNNKPFKGLYFTKTKPIQNQPI